jgi:hypothetical protein
MRHLPPAVVAVEAEPEAVVAAGRSPVAAALVVAAVLSVTPVVVPAAVAALHHAVGAEAYTAAAALDLEGVAALDPQRVPQLALDLLVPGRVPAWATPIVRTTWGLSRSARIPVRHGPATLFKVLAAASGVRLADPVAAWRSAISDRAAAEVRPSSVLVAAALPQWSVLVAGRLALFAAPVAQRQPGFVALVVRPWVRHAARWAQVA